MEMIAYVIIALLVALIAYFIWKNYRLKQDIYDFTKKLDTALNRMLNDHEAQPEVEMHHTAAPQLAASWLCCSLRKPWRVPCAQR